MTTDQRPTQDILESITKALATGKHSDFYMLQIELLLNIRELITEQNRMLETSAEEQREARQMIITQSQALQAFLDPVIPIGVGGHEIEERLRRDNQSNGDEGKETGKLHEVSPPPQE